MRTPVLRVGPRHVFSCVVPPERILVKYVRDNPCNLG
jgi:hypothetical protein